MPSLVSTLKRGLATRHPQKASSPRSQSLPPKVPSRDPLPFITRAINRGSGNTVRGEKSADAGDKLSRCDGDILDQAATPLLLGSIASFLLLSYDLFESSTWPSMSALDLNIRDWATTTISIDYQNLLGGSISDLFIVPELILWPVLCYLILESDIIEGAMVVALSSIAYALGGSFLHGDALLVDYLKVTFHRIRPSLNHRTFSFPSGHTCAAVVLTGTVLFVFLPMVLENYSIKFKNDGESNGQTKSIEVAQVIQKILQSTGPYVWASSYLITAAGRVGGNAHWFSDTLGGLLVGIGLVSSLKILVNYCRTTWKNVGNDL